jgi:hypothetical protein
MDLMARKQSEGGDAETFCGFEPQEFQKGKKVKRG